MRPPRDATPRLPGQPGCVPRELHGLVRANKESRILVTKDADFQLSFELGNGPPKLLLVTTGNIHNDELAGLFSRHEFALLRLLDQHGFVELSRTALIVHR
jgi:predicted nuclease of predicted toxin-antitoxin system